VLRFLLVDGFFSSLSLLQLFSQIDSTRADHEESLKEVAIACAAIDRLVGDERKSKEVSSSSDSLEFLIDFYV
jgi:hypothetical protein